MDDGGRKRRRISRIRIRYSLSFHESSRTPRETSKRSSLTARGSFLAPQTGPWFVMRPRGVFTQVGFDKQYKIQEGHMDEREIEREEPPLLIGSVIGSQKYLTQAPKVNKAT